MHSFSKHMYCDEKRRILLEPGASWSILPLIQTIHSFCLSKDHLRINTFFLLFYSDKVSHGDSWDSRKPISFLVDQTSIYIKTIQLFLIVWIRGLLVSCLRVACLVLRESECNYWYITVSEWRHHLASLSGLIFRPCLICKYNHFLCFTICEQVHYLIFRVYLYFAFERLL